MTRARDLFGAVVIAIAAAGATLTVGAQQSPAQPAQPQAPAQGRAATPPPPPIDHSTPFPAPPQRTVEQGYTSLFNGKDLTGWKVGGPVEAFRVQNGAIVAHGTTGASHLFYDGPVNNHTFLNFNLRLDVMARQRSNGGVYVLTEFQEKGFPGKGFEIQVNNSHTDRIRTGSLYHVVDLSHVPGKDDEWIPMEIQVQQNTITVSLRGEQVLQWKQPEGWTSNYDTASRRIAPGTIAFQAHDPNSLTAYANIRIRPLQ
jgi:hypothetical protein